MALVIDASVAACWLLPDETHPVAEAALDRLLHEPATVPQIWWYEMRNLLLSCERRRRIDAPRTAAALAILAGLPIAIAPLPSDDAVLELARRHRLSIYDATYIELALRESAALATLDTALAEAARAEAISLIGG
jgi:predicted nucleic acid-binding protein